MTAPQWPTDDLCARLRALHSIVANEAADRLEEADDENEALRYEAIHRFRYLCNSGHHVASAKRDLTVCSARAVLGWLGHGVPDYGPECGAELRRYSDDPAWELDEIREAMPNCFACGGKGEITTASTAPDSHGYILGATIPCPDCPETPGKVSVRRLVALWETVHSDGPLTVIPRGAGPTHIVRATLEALRREASR